MKQNTLFCFSLLLAAAGRADTIAWNPTVGEDGEYSAPAFDSSLGTLTGALLNLSAQASLSLTLSNPSATYGGFYGIFVPSLMIQGYPVFQFLRVDQLMLSGMVEPGSSYTAQRTVGFYRNGLPLAGIGADPWTFTLDTNSGVYGVWWDLNLRGASVRMDLMSAGLSGEYEYTPTPVVTHNPEPGYFVLLALAGLVLVVRKRRAGP